MSLNPIVFINNELVDDIEESIDGQEFSNDIDEWDQETQDILDLDELFP